MVRTVCRFACPPMACVCRVHPIARTQVNLYTVRCPCAPVKQVTCDIRHTCFLYNHAYLCIVMHMHSYASACILMHAVVRQDPKHPRPPSPSPAPDTGTRQQGNRQQGNRQAGPPGSPHARAPLYIYWPSGIFCSILEADTANRELRTYGGLIGGVQRKLVV
jgi:hypothetical protein